jgi:hypothetical protein
VLDESQVPVANRVLLVEGRASPGLLELVRDGLPPLGRRDVLLVMTFAYADIPLGKRFQVWSVDGSVPVQVDAELVAVTQQFAKPFDEVPHGWKTLTVVRFSPNVPEAVASLPEVDGWYERRDLAFLCTQDTWDARSSGDRGSAPDDATGR